MPHVHTVTIQYEFMGYNKGCSVVCDNVVLPLTSLPHLFVIMFPFNVDDIAYVQGVVCLPCTKLPENLVQVLAAP